MNMIIHNAVLPSTSRSLGWFGSDREPAQHTAMHSGTSGSVGGAGAIVTELLQDSISSMTTLSASSLVASTVILVMPQSNKVVGRRLSAIYFARVAGNYNTLLIIIIHHCLYCY